MSAELGLNVSVPPATLLPEKWIRQHAAPRVFPPRRMRNRWAGYIRYSTKEDRESSVERQAAAIETYAKRLGATPAQRQHTYIDRNLSGAYTLTRDELQRLLTDARAGSFDILIVEHLDRLSRKLSGMACIFEELQSLGVAIHSAEHGAVTDMEIAMAAYSAATQRVRIAQITSQGIWQAAEAGRNTGSAPYGYRTSPNRRGLLLKDSSEEKVIVRIFEMLAAGASGTQIAYILNREGISSPGGREWDDHAITGVASEGSGIARNPKYKGVFVYGRKKVLRSQDGLHERRSVRDPESWVVVYKPEWQMVPSELWDIVQQRLANRATGPRRRRSEHAEFLWAGKIFCACGARLIAKSSSTPGARLLLCSAATRKGTCRNRRGITLRYVDREILGMIRDELLGGEATVQFAAEYQREYERVRREVMGAQTELVRIRREALAKLDGSFDPNFRPEVKEETRGELRTLWQSQIEECDTALASFRSIGEAPRIDHAGIADLRQRMTDLMARLPLVVRTEADLMLATALREIVESMRIEFDGNPGFNIVLTGYLGGMREVDGMGGAFSPKRCIVRRCAKPNRWSFETPRCAVVRGEAAGVGFDLLSDSDWSLVEPIVARLRHRHIERRRLVDAVLFHLRTGTCFERMPMHFGPRPTLQNAMRLLVRKGIWDLALEALRGAGSHSVERLSTATVDRIVRCPYKRMPKGGRC
ncbi:recombinase family protein [Methylorubrum thiocyanatum]|uniref:recombinase family protein n=1 Tax=Methylorubrum thiocyanatum TaxID=47958 RepID=UPI0035C8520C